jgi:hypothetical protein
MKNSIQYLKDRNGTDLVGVEIGVGNGATTLSILQNLDIKMLYLVDTKIPLGAENALKDYKDKITWVIKETDKPLDGLPDELDFVFIDGNNNEKAALQDLPTLYPKVKYGGLFSGHDWQKPEGQLSMVDFTVERAYDAKRYMKPKFQTWDKSGTDKIDWWLVK